MRYKAIVISSGHGKHVAGASGILGAEVAEARRVVDRVAAELADRGVAVKVFHDNTSHDVNTNLGTIVSYHNSQVRELDVSVHFNAYVETTGPRGTECLYVTQEELSADVSAAIAACGFIDRGAKEDERGLYFLNNTKMPAILIEVCFVDSVADADAYHSQFDEICKAIADTLAGTAAEAPEPGEPDPADVLLHLRGKASSFGGPADEGVAPDEPLAFIQKVSDAPHLFLAHQPPDTTGLARRLDPTALYVACRWDYDVTPRDMLLEEMALVRAVATGKALVAHPADWGPHHTTDRVADLSPGLMDALGLDTDDEVEVIFPASAVRPLTA